MSTILTRSMNRQVSRRGIFQKAFGPFHAGNLTVNGAWLFCADVPYVFQGAQVVWAVASSGACILQLTRLPSASAGGPETGFAMHEETGPDLAGTANTVATLTPNVGTSGAINQTACLLRPGDRMGLTVDAATTGLVGLIVVATLIPNPDFLERLSEV